MSNALNTLGKSKKVALMPGWKEGISRKHPDRPFYFNKDDSRWSPPIKSPEDKNKSEKKNTKKRKINDRDSEDFSDASPGVSKKLLSEILTRPKLKARAKNAADSNATEASNDTPAMRFVREKMAQRKAEAMLKKNVSKKVASASNQKKLKITTDLEKSDKAPTTSITTRRSQRGSSVSSTSTSVSECSAASSATSMGTKITRAVVSATKVASPSITPKTVQTNKASNLPKIPRTSLSQLNASNANIVADEDLDSGCEDIPQKIPRRSLANDRLNKLRKSLEAQKNESPVIRHFSEPRVIDSGGDPHDKSKLNFPTSFKSKNPHTGLLHLEKHTETNCSLIIKNIKQHQVEEDDPCKNKKIYDKIRSPCSMDYEDMEWEPIEDEKIMSEVYSARVKLCENPLEELSELSSTVLKSSNVVGEKNALYIVVDTNVLLSNLSFLEEVRDSNSDIFGRPFIVIPWTVLQELDFIKDDKNNTRSVALKNKARKAVEFLNRHFTAKHPRFLGQTPTEVEKNKEKFMIECPDDEILQTCLQIKESNKSPVLLSYDKNLCTKAMIHDIPILGRNDPLEKVYYLKAAETTQFLSNSLHAHTEEKQEDNSILEQELLAADDIMEEGKAVLKSVLTQVVAKEMESLFGNRWEKHVIIPPPWTVATVLKCALKHWVAAVSESFSVRKTEHVLKDIQLCINETPADGRKLKDVKIFLDKCMVAVETLNVAKYSAFKDRMVAKLIDLSKKCLDSMNKINGELFQETVGVAEESKEEKRAEIAFKVLEEVYAYARDTCGIAAEVIGLQCAFTYNKFNTCITQKLAIQEHEDIGNNVKKLLQILRISLSSDYKNMCPDDTTFVSLYEVLVNFSSNIKCDELSQLTPLDIFCCIKLKKSKIEKGYGQLQELAVHFCRMANFQCK